MKNLSKDKSVIVFSWIVGIVVAAAIFLPSIIQSLQASQTPDLRPQLERDINKNKAEMQNFIDSHSPK